MQLNFCRDVLDDVNVLDSGKVLNGRDVSVGGDILGGGEIFLCELSRGVILRAEIIFGSGDFIERSCR